jgi:flagellar basal body rod protein FlgG
MIRFQTACVLAIVGLMAGCHETIPAPTAPVPSSAQSPVAELDRAICATQFNLEHAEERGFKAMRPRYVHGKPSKLELNVEQGPAEQTGRHLDVAISGDGFFALKTKSGTVYRRNGNFFVNHEGRLVSSSGHTVQPGIVISHGATAFWISEDGDVSCAKPGSTRKSFAGRIQLYHFPNPAGLAIDQEGHLIETSESGIPSELNSDESRAPLLQDFLEASNVNVSQERLRLKRLQTLRDELLRSGSLTRVETEPAH